MDQHVHTILQKQGKKIIMVLNNKYSLNSLDIFTKPLTTRAIRTFHAEFVKDHEGSDHPIFVIPAGYTLLEGLSYIYADNAPPISALLQEYVYGVKQATEIVKMIREGIKYKSVCLTCLRNNALNNMLEMIEDSRRAYYP